MSSQFASRPPTADYSPLGLGTESGPLWKGREFPFKARSDLRSKGTAKTPAASQSYPGTFRLAGHVPAPPLLRYGPVEGAVVVVSR